MSNNDISRRHFLSQATWAGAGLLAGPPVLAGINTQQNPTDKEKRRLGTLEVSALGLGCMSMAGVYNAPQPKNEMVAVSVLR